MGGEGGNGRHERGPVPDDRPAPPCFAMLPAAVVLTVVAVAAHWLGMSRRQLLRAVALGVVATGLMSLLAGAAWTLWLYDLVPAALTCALLVLYLVSTLATGDGASRRTAAVGAEGSPAAATPMLAAVAEMVPPGPRGRHRRLELGRVR